MFFLIKKILKEFLGGTFLERNKNLENNEIFYYSTRNLNKKENLEGLEKDERIKENFISCLNKRNY